MSRIGWLLLALAVLLVGVLWWFLVWTPTSEDIESARADTEAAQAQTVQLRQRETQLREIRQSAPEIEADLNRAQLLIPEGPSLPELFRQLQQAADESGATLVSAAPSRPADVADAPDGLSSMQVNFAIEGNYFQFVDLARRLEDPGITGRGLIWRNVTITVNEHPLLSGSLSAEIFTRTPTEDLPADDEAGDTDDGEGAGEPERAPAETPERDEEEVL